MNLQELAPEGTSARLRRLVHAHPGSMDEIDWEDRRHGLNLGTFMRLREQMMALERLSYSAAAANPSLARVAA